MRCIICLRNDPPEGFSLEHIFPEAVGGVLTTCQVCEPCNSKLGHSVDGTVTDHTLVKIARMALGIAGKTGKVPNPFANGFMHGEPDQKVRLDATKAGPLVAYLIPKVTRTTTAPGEGEISVQLDA